MKAIWKIIFFPLVLLAACNQDPIFTMISNEVEPKDPLIKGSPSKLVEYSGNIYVANGGLWRANAVGKWGEVGGVPSKIYDIATGNDGLYLLSVNNSDTSVHKLGGGRVGNAGYDMIQGLYSDGDTVYAGAMSGDNYAILEITRGAFSFVQSISSPLAGVAKTNNATYFATARNGILRRGGGNIFTVISGSSGYSIAGIINVNDRIIAVTGNGTILEVDVVNNKAIAHGTSTYFTGGLAVYEGNTANSSVKLLLLGVKNDIYNMGYREMDISNGNISFNLYVPGERASFSTVSGRDRYEATLAKCAVNSLIQLSTASGGGDGLPVLFASTQKNGLWSYRNNEWNAEE